MGIPSFRRTAPKIKICDSYMSFKETCLFTSFFVFKLFLNVFFHISAENFSSVLCCETRSVEQRGSRGVPPSKIGVVSQLPSCHANPSKNFSFKKKKICKNILPKCFRLFRLRFWVVAELGIPFPERLHEVFACFRS